MSVHRHDPRRDGGEEGDRRRNGHRQDGRRVGEIDAVRGLALCGILPANIAPITGMRLQDVAGEDPGAVRHLYEALVHQRFFPVFSFLFGISAVLFMKAVRGGAEPPRVVLLARFGFLLPFGLVHQLLQPGEVLVIYAVAGIVVLLPASFLPRAVVLAAGAAATLAALLVAEGGVTLVPGLFLLGMAAGAYGVPDLVARRSRRVAVAFVPTALLAAGLDIWQVVEGAAAFDSPLPATAGVATGAAYATGLLMLLRNDRLDAVLSPVLQPLGRLALTNYVTATPLVIVADHLLDLGDDPRAATVAGTALTIITVQTAFSRAWLRRHRHGPLEWAWRCLTWWRFVPNKISTPR